LSNGKQIVLDSAGNGTLASDSHIKVIKKDGQLSYEGKTAEVLYNTVSTPKGRQWQLTLNDGTKVWLNAASSIHYPINFIGNQRIIEITGEAYLEVSPNASVPFIVKTPTQEIQVLGTHFNINAYADEPILRTTLVEGSIKVTAAGKTTILHPAEQVANNTAIGDLATTKPDVSNVIAWINGRFKFDHSDIKTVMRQIARWYDVEVEYRGTLPDYQFAGGTFRNNNLSEVLQVLELSGLHFKLENHKIIVMQ
jgi:ferric-dicitrate binding protein FerR (iron transport regulator)